MNLNLGMNLKLGIGVSKVKGYCEINSCKNLAVFNYSLPIVDKNTRELSSKSVRVCTTHYAMLQETDWDGT